MFLGGAHKSSESYTATSTLDPTGLFHAPGRPDLGCCLLYSHEAVSNSSATPWTVACHAPLSMGFPSQEYRSGLPFPPPGDLPNPGINLCLLHCRQLLHHCTTWEDRPQIALANSGCSKNCKKKKKKFTSYKPNLCFLKKKVKIAQSCPILCDPRDYTVHRILQARILEWVAYSFSRGSSQPRDGTQVSHIAGRFFTSWATIFLTEQQM